MSEAWVRRSWLRCCHRVYPPPSGKALPWEKRADDHLSCMHFLFVVVPLVAHVSHPHVAALSISGEDKDRLWK